MLLQRKIERNSVGIGLSAASHLMPLALLVYAMVMFPPEVKFNIIQVNLTPYRIVLIASGFSVFNSFLKLKVRINIADLLMISAAGASFVSFLHHYGLATGGVRAFGFIIDSLGAYLVARTSIRSIDDARLFLLLILPAFLYAGGSMVYESVSRHLVVRPFFVKYFGATLIYDGSSTLSAREFRYEYRLGGLLRAYGPFSHPILGGLILTSSLLLYWRSGLKGIPGKLGACVGFCGFFGLSSASIISILLAVSIHFVDYFIKQVKLLNWWLIISAVVGVGMLVEIASQNGLLSVLIRQTLDPQTGYFRKLIWKFGLLSVENNPWYGIGYRDYERDRYLVPTSSVDAHFLALAMRDGVILPLCQLAAIFLISWRIGVAAGSLTLSKADRKFLIGVNGALIGLVIASMTVAYFGEGLLWFMAILGLAATLGQPEALKKAKPLQGVKKIDLASRRAISSRDEA